MANGPAPKTRLDLTAVSQWAVIILAVLAVFAALAMARSFLVPVILAFLLALVFRALCRWLRVVARHRVIVGARRVLPGRVSGWVAAQPGRRAAPGGRIGVIPRRPTRQSPRTLRSPAGL